MSDCITQNIPSQSKPTGFLLKLSETVKHKMVAAGWTDEWIITAKEEGNGRNHGVQN